MLTRPLPKTAKVGIFGTIVIIIVAAILLPMAKAQKSETASTHAPTTKDVITDPNTGLQFRKSESVTGENDVVRDTLGLEMSPNGKFLLFCMQVVPLEDGKPFKLVDLPSGRNSWSPDGKNIAFYSGGVWLIPVSPDTAKPTGPAKKLIEGQYWFGVPVAWSPDSQSFAYMMQAEGRLGVYSLQDGSRNQITKELAISGWTKSWSPDGKWIACTCYDNQSRAWMFSLLSIEGLAPRKLVEAEGMRRLNWLPDGNWVFSEREQKLRFVRITDSQCVDVNLPKEVGDFLSCSQDSKKLLFYKPSYDFKMFLKIVPASGGASLESLKKLPDLDLYMFLWTADSRFFASRDDERYWVIPTTGGEAFALQLKVQVPGKLIQESISPDGKKLLFSAEKDGEKEYWVAPISIEKGTTTGTPVKVFDKPKETGRIGVPAIIWAPDGSKLAITYQDDIWILYGDGSTPIRVTNTPEIEYPEYWSPDGKTLTWRSYSNSPERSVLYVCELPKGEPRKLIEIFGTVYLRSVCEQSRDGTKMAYIVQDGDRIVLSVIATAGGEPKKLMETDLDNRAGLGYAFSPDSQELAVAVGGKLSVFSLSNGERREIADFSEQALWRCYDIGWSPDAQTIAMILERKPGTGEGTRIFTVPAQGGKLTELTKDDIGEKYYYDLDWSPDGKWIAYDSEDAVKTRPEGVIWEVEIDSFLKKAAEKTAAAPSPTKD